MWVCVGVCVCSIGYHVEKFIKDFPLGTTLGHIVWCLWLVGGLKFVCLNVLVPVRWVHRRLIFEVIKGTAGGSPDGVAAAVVTGAAAASSAAAAAAP